MGLPFVFVFTAGGPWLPKFPRQSAPSAGQPPSADQPPSSDLPPGDFGPPPSAEPPPSADLPPSAEPPSSADRPARRRGYPPTCILFSTRRSSEAPPPPTAELPPPTAQQPPPTADLPPGGFGPPPSADLPSAADRPRPEAPEIGRFRGSIATSLAPPGQAPSRRPRSIASRSRSRSPTPVEDYWDRYRSLICLPRYRNRRPRSIASRSRSLSLSNWCPRRVELRSRRSVSRRPRISLRSRPRSPRPLYVRQTPSPSRSHTPLGHWGPPRCRLDVDCEFEPRCPSCDVDCDVEPRCPSCSPSSSSWPSSSNRLLAASVAARGVLFTAPVSRRGFAASGEG